MGASDQSTDGGESETTQKAAPTGTSGVDESAAQASGLPRPDSSSGSPSEGQGVSGSDGSTLRQPDPSTDDETLTGVIAPPPEPAPTKSSISSTTPSSSVVSTSSATVAAGSVTKKDGTGSSNQSVAMRTDVEPKSAGDVGGASREVGLTAPELQRPNHVKSNSNSSSDDNISRHSWNGKDPRNHSSEASRVQPDSVAPAPVVAPRALPVPSHHDVSVSSGGSRAIQMTPTIPEQSESSEADARGPEQEMKKRTNSISSTAAVTSVTTEVSSVEPPSASIGPNGSNVPSLAGPSLPPDMVSLGSVTSNFENSTIATAGTMNADFRFQQLPPLPPVTNGPQNQQTQMQQGVPQSQGQIPVGQQILRTSATNEDSASGSQQAVPQSGSFEIPGVVTLTAVEALDESSLPNTSQSQLPQHASEQVNTIGSVPIMKIQGEGMVVKKKKGRFNILQEAPSVRKPGSSAGSGSIPGQTPQIGAGSHPSAANAPQAGSPASSQQGQHQPEFGSVHSNTNSLTTAPAAATGVQSSSPGTSLTGPMAQSTQAGDPISPAVKKKGRFVLMKVDGSGKNPKPVAPQAGQSQHAETASQQQPQPQGRPPAVDKIENEQKQHQVGPTHPPENIHGQTIPQNLQHQQQSQQQLELQQMQRQQQELQQQQQQQEIQKLRQIQHQQQELHHRQQSQQQLEEIQKLQQMHHKQQQELQQLQQIQQQAFQRQQQNHQAQHLQIYQAQHIQIPSGPQQPNINLEMRPANWSQTTYVVNQQVPIPAETVNDEIQQPLPPQQHLVQSQRGSQDAPARALPPGVPTNLQLPQTPPQHRGVNVPPAVDTGKAGHAIVQQASANPVTPVPMGPTAGSSVPAQPSLPPRPNTSHPAELPKSEAANRQRVVNRTPQAFDNKGGLSNVGLGKVFYFLDQMKLEVSDADRTIKNLQTDMKILVSARQQFCRSRVYFSFD